MAHDRLALALTCRGRGNLRNRILLSERVKIEMSRESSREQPDPTPSRTVTARLLIGLIVLICAEVFSGASLQAGLWNLWTLLVTYWLYFAHFFFFTTVAVRTGRTSFWSLYLWGILFGLYESWITKVIWSGYGGDGKLAMGRIGPYGFSEISMVVIFHPVVSFILPLAVACLLCPPLRRFFPDLAWLTGTARSARLVRGYLVICFATIMAMNSGGPLNLAMNLAFALCLLGLLMWRARPALHAADGRANVVFGRKGFVGLCGYLVLLYGVTYFLLRPAALPSIPVQLLTFVFYGLVIGGLYLHARREPLPAGAVSVEQRERRLGVSLFALILVFGLALSPFRGQAVVFVPVVISFLVWTPIGLLLTAIALTAGFWQRPAVKARAL
jgi:hypothetical protein